jgi:hypothetical protein
LDPFNESPWRYLIGLLKEQQKMQQQNNNNDNDCKELLEEYERKAFALRDVLTQAKRDPDTCVNLTSARIDILEMIGGKGALGQVREVCMCRAVDVIMYLFTLHVK